jgi:hypothetical protein
MCVFAEAPDLRESRPIEFLLEPACVKGTIYLKIVYGGIALSMAGTHCTVPSIL